MNGSSWNFNLLHIDEQEIFVPLENRESRNRWQSILEQLNRGDFKKLIIVNFGMQTHNSVSSLLGFMRDNKIQNLTDDIFYNYYIKENILKIELAKILLSKGHKILVVSDPPVRSVNKFLNQFNALFLYFDEQSLKIFKDLGCDTFNAGVYFSGDKFSEKYYSGVVLNDGHPEAIHGSDAYYVDLAKVIIDNHVNQQHHSPARWHSPNFLDKFHRRLVSFGSWRLWFMQPNLVAVAVNIENTANAGKFEFGQVGLNKCVLHPGCFAK